MSGDHNMYCSANQPDLIEKLRETSAEIVKDTLPRWKNLDEYMDEAADEIERLREQLAASRAREAKLREALEESAYYSQTRKTDPIEFCGLRCEPHDPFWQTVKEAIELPHDDTALCEYRRKVLLEAAELCGLQERAVGMRPAGCAGLIRTMAEEK